MDALIDSLGELVGEIDDVTDGLIVVDKVDDDDGVVVGVGVTEVSDGVGIVAVLEELEL